MRDVHGRAWSSRDYVAARFVLGRYHELYARLVVRMNSLLYISPYFPPDPRVGALRPLKFARHLPAFGFRPVVLADLPNGRRDEQLCRVLPEDVVVVHDYGLFTRRRAARVTALSATAPRWAKALAGPVVAGLHQLLDQPELVPLGPHALDVPHALGAGLKLIRQYDCRAILVNADPFAASLVGALLASHCELPLVVDFRDPWAPCELRAPLRRPWVRASVDALERFVVERATRVVLNTEQARAAYVAHHPHVDPARFACVPNHADPTLTPVRREARERTRGARLTLLLAGSLRRFLDGDVLLEVLTACQARGLGPERIGLTVVGRSPASFLERAARSGVADYVQLEEPVSYLEVQALQARADVLVVLGHRDRQRVPAKFYDAALSRRPLLVVTENPELCGLAERIGGARVFGYAQAQAIAAWLSELCAGDRVPEYTRLPQWTSESATERLAALLTQAA